MIERLLLLSFMIITQQSNATSQEQKPSRLILTDCEIAGVEGKVRCGEYEVFENRATQKGRKIKLKIVVYPATGSRAPDPFVYIPGGPGSSATEDSPYIAEALHTVNGSTNAEPGAQRPGGVDISLLD